MKGRRFRLGPATTLAIAGAIALAYARFPAWQQEAHDAQQIQAMRAQVAHAKPGRNPFPRNIEALLQAGNRLQLSTPQRQRLERLHAEEQKHTAPLEQDAELAARTFKTWMENHRTGVSLQEMQQQAGIYSAASRPLAREREQFWNRALLILTPAQRAQIQARTQSSP